MIKPKQYIVTYNHFYKENVLLEVEKMNYENNTYDLKCGKQIRMNHLLTEIVDEYQVEDLLKSKNVLDGSMLEYYKNGSQDVV